MLLDTCFLIDLQREFRAGRVGDARRFLQAHADTAFSISVISVTEFLEGFEDPADGEKLINLYARVDIDSKIAAHAANFRRELRLSGQLIGDFDILIAATAAGENLPLVTDNIARFKRVPSIEVISYLEAAGKSR